MVLVSGNDAQVETKVGHSVFVERCGWSYGDAIPKVEVQLDRYFCRHIYGGIMISHEMVGFPVGRQPSVA